MHNCSHPLAGHHHQMGFLSDIQSWGQDLIDDFNKDYVDPALESVGLSKEQADKIKADAAKAAQSELNKQKDQLAKDIASQVLGDGKGGMQAKTPTPTINTGIEFIDDFQKSPIVASVPGGIYTIAGGALILTFMLLRGRG